MSRLEEVEAEIDGLYAGYSWEGEARTLRTIARTLAAEVDELRGKLDDVRMGIGCARGQRSTQYCADLTQRDEVITKLLALVKPEDGNMDAFLHVGDLHTRACEIARRTE